MRQPSNPTVIRDDSKWILHDRHRVCVAYLMNGAATKPYVSMLAAPSGRNLLADAPSDHIHHLGIWWGHGDVNGVTFYLELPTEEPGEIRHVEWLDRAPAAGDHGFVERLDWVAPSGETLIAEERSLGVSFSREDGYWLYLDNTYTAQADLTLGTTKESALPIIRMADAASRTRSASRRGGSITTRPSQTGTAALAWKAWRASTTRATPTTPTPGSREAMGRCRRERATSLLVSSSSPVARRSASAMRSSSTRATSWKPRSKTRGSNTVRRTPRADGPRGVPSLAERPSRLVVVLAWTVTVSGVLVFLV